MSRDIATCSRRSCNAIATRYCPHCKRAFCEPHKRDHDGRMHGDEESESEALSGVLAVLAKLDKAAARRVLKLVAAQMGLVHVPGLGRVKR